MPNQFVRSNCKDLDKRLHTIRANQELSAKLADKTVKIMEFISRANEQVDSEFLPQNPQDLEKVCKKFGDLLEESNTLQVSSKMVTDWSAEISKGTNPSRSVDEAESMSGQLSGKF
jgi:hypothetical protein